MLDKIRKETGNSVITEKQLNKQKGTTRGEEGEIITDYGNKGEAQNAKDFDKSKGTEGEPPFDEKFQGEEYVGKRYPKQVGNVQKSQLLSNYTDREAFRKANPSIKSSAVEKLADSDAIIYHFYKQASLQGRALNSYERKFIDKINKNKITVLAQFQEELHPNIHNEEQQEIKAEDTLDFNNDLSGSGDLQKHRNFQDSVNPDKDAEFEALADYENTPADDMAYFTPEETNDVGNFGSPDELKVEKKKPFFGINRNNDENNIDQAHVVQ